MLAAVAKLLGLPTAFVNLESVAVAPVGGARRLMQVSQINLPPWRSFTCPSCKHGVHSLSLLLRALPPELVLHQV